MGSRLVAVHCSFFAHICANDLPSASSVHFSRIIARTFPPPLSLASGSDPDHRPSTAKEIFIINYSLFTISYVPSVFRPFLQPRASSQIHLRTFRIFHLPNPHLRSHHGFLQAPKIDQCRVVIGPFSVRFRIVIGPITRDQRHARSQNHINHH